MTDRGGDRVGTTIAATVCRRPSTPVLTLALRVGAGAVAAGRLKLILERDAGCGSEVELAFDARSLARSCARSRSCDVIDGVGVGARELARLPVTEPAPVPVPIPVQPGPPDASGT